MHRCDWPELFGMARTKDSAQRYQTILSAAILLAEVVGWERDYVGRSGWLLCTLWVLAVGSTKVRACYIVSADVCSCPRSQNHPLWTCLLLELHAPLPSPGESLVCACIRTYVHVRACFVYAVDW